MSHRKPTIRFRAIVFWIVLWQAIAMLVGHDFLLASPLTTALRFLHLACTKEFWTSALFSLCRIFSGFLLGMIAGVICAGLSVRFRCIRELLFPLWTVLRAIPVASFVIVALIWVPSRNLSVLISFLIVFPLIYAETIAEIECADPKLSEMARLFRMSPYKRIVYVYALPMLGRFETACAGAIGLAWKSGTAAELIAIPTGSIGEKLYTAKVYLMTGDLLAWTILILLLSSACTRIFAFLLRQIAHRLERM